MLWSLPHNEYIYIVIIFTKSQIARPNMTTDESPCEILTSERYSRPCTAAFSESLAIAGSLTQPAPAEIQAREIHLGPTQKRHTLVLDLDNTLVHSTCCSSSPASEGRATYTVTVRPYVSLLLERLSPLYEIVLFTAGSDAYAEAMRRKLDPEGTMIVRALGRSSCIVTKEGRFVKDMRILADRELKHVVIVDDRVENFAFQLGNGIPVAPFMGDDEDEEIIYLIEYLEDLHAEDDLASVNRKRINLVY